MLNLDYQAEAAKFVFLFIMTMRLFFGRVICGANIGSGELGDAKPGWHEPRL